MELKEEIAAKRSEIRSDGYSMSIGELIALYRDGELDIHPEFQRFYRWSEEQKSRLIESLLLGIPIPSIFVSQKEDGVWDVIDGLQRLSTIFQLVGILKDENGHLVDPLTLTRTKYLPSLEGVKWENEGNPEKEIGAEHQLLIKRSKLDVKIILRESSESSKYELFQRLNTGGSELSDQELRNCVLITVDRHAYEWISQLNADPNFRACIALTDRAVLEQYDVELIVRFLVFRQLKEGRLRNIGDIGEFLTDELIALVQSQDFNMVAEQEIFRFIFEKLAASLGPDSFRRWDAAQSKYSGGFLLSAFEALAIGFGYHAKEYIDGKDLPDFKELSRSLWQNERFTRYTGSGVRAASRIPVVIPLGRSLFEK